VARGDVTFAGRTRSYITTIVMTRNPVVAVAAALLLAALLATPARAAEPAPPAASAPSDQAYEQAIAKRADDILKVIGDLNDPAKTSRVREAILAQYRALNAWHNAHDAELKALSRAPAETAKPKAEAVKATLKPIHDDFIKGLSQDLTAEQVEAVKDKMTYNVVHVTYNAFCDMIPTLTDEQKSYVLATLKDAREEAMDGGSSEEKHAIFGRYKGRINNYLSKQGYDLKKETKAWEERRKAGQEKGRQNSETKSGATAASK
jgi:hypothetical protein